MKIKAAVLRAMGAPAPYAQSKPLSIEEVELDPPGPDEVLVKVAAADCAIPIFPSSTATGRARCRWCSATRRPAWSKSSAQASTTSNAATMSAWCSCRAAATACPAPKAGRRCASPALRPTARASCSAAGGGSSATASRSTTTWACPCFAQYATVSRHSLIKIDPEMPLDEAAMFGCAVLTGVGAVLNTAAVRPGQSVAVVGLGGVGLTALLGALVAGARTVVAIDINEQKLGLARQLGATHVFNGADPGCRRRGQGGDRGRRRRRGRDGRLGQGAGDGLQDHAPRRPDRHRRPAQPRAHDGDLAGQPGRRGAHPEGQLYRQLRAAARPAALHRASIAPASCRSTACSATA